MDNIRIDLETPLCGQKPASIGSKSDRASKMVSFLRCSNIVSESSLVRISKTLKMSLCYFGLIRKSENSVIYSFSGNCCSIVYFQNIWKVELYSDQFIRIERRCVFLYFISRDHVSDLHHDSADVLNHIAIVSQEISYSSIEAVTVASKKRILHQTSRCRTDSAIITSKINHLVQRSVINGKIEVQEDLVESSIEAYFFFEERKNKKKIRETG